MQKEIYYIIRDCGDGSAAVDFYSDKELAELANKVNELEAERYGGFTEGEVRTLHFSIVDGDELIMSKYEGFTRDELEERLKELE